MEVDARCVSVQDTENLLDRNYIPRNAAQAGRELSLSPPGNFKVPEEFDHEDGIDTGVQSDDLTGDSTPTCPCCLTLALG